MIEYREYSFLQNKRLPPAVKASSIKVGSCKFSEHNCRHVRLTKCLRWRLSLCTCASLRFL